MSIDTNEFSFDLGLNHPRPNDVSMFFCYMYIYLLIHVFTI